MKEGRVMRRMMMVMAMIAGLWAVPAQAGTLFTGTTQLLSFVSFFHQPQSPIGVSVLGSSAVFLESVSPTFRTEVYFVNLLASVGNGGFTAGGTGQLASYKFREQYGNLVSGNGQTFTANRDITAWKPIFLVSSMSSTTADLTNVFAKPLVVFPTADAVVPWLFRTAPGSRIWIDFQGGGAPYITGDIWYIYRSTSPLLTPGAR